MKKRIAYLIAFFAMVLGCFLIPKIRNYHPIHD